MSGLGRLFAFAAALGVLFAGTAAVGRAVGPLERGGGQPHATAHAPAADAAPAGLAVAANGFRLAATQTTFAPRGRERFEFRIVGARAFDVVHARRMHLIVVRRDLAHFQHLHPRQGKDGVWATDLRLPAAGVYRAFADFSADGKRTVLGVDLFAAGKWAPQTLPPAQAIASVGDYRVAISNTHAVHFDIWRRGRAVEPQPYLGARGHLVVLRAGDLAYVHAHPAAREFAFETHLPSPGTYRAFLQFKHGGRVRTVAFVLKERA